MSEGLTTQLEQIARRAGLKGVSPPVLWGALALTGIAVAWALWHWWPVAGADAVVFESDGIEKSVPPQGPAASIEPSAAPEPVGVIVHVVGCVRHPGVYELPAGSRVVDAIDAAGGTLPDAVVAAVNMARPLADGEQIAVPDEDDPQAVSAATGAPSAAPGAGGAGAASPGGLVDLNSADAVALETLPGVGPSTAAKIVADREANGPFSSVDDLARVSGIGPKKLEEIRAAACVR